MRGTISDSCCGKSIDVEALEAAQRRVPKTVLVNNLATFTMMLAAAQYSRSSTLLSGALDNFGDALTYALSLAVVGASSRAKDKVALVKAGLILLAAIVVAFQIGWYFANPIVPLFEGIGVAAFINLGANLVCLRLLTPYRHGDVNLVSAWECSRNDMFDGLAGLTAAVGVWWFDARWPDLIIATGLLLLLSRSAWRVSIGAFDSLQPVR